MIPKIIHYCWFGGAEIPEADQRCIDSWRKYCPDYTIMRWDESNYDCTKNRYMKEAYDAKKWSFVSDYARLDVVYTCGGVYLDTDVELIRPIDDLLENRAYMGFESGGAAVNSGLGFGAEKKFPLIGSMLDEIYGARNFKLGKYDYDTTPCPVLCAEFLAKRGLKKNNRQQTIEGMVIYPSEWFCPTDFVDGEFRPTANTHTIHHFHSSWLSPEEKKILRLTRDLVKRYGQTRGEAIAEKLGKFYRLKMHLRTKGIKGTAEFSIKKLAKKIRG